MATPTANHQQSFHAGKVILHQVENRTKQPWLRRIEVQNGTGYMRRGTGACDLYQAGTFADGLRIKAKFGQSITGPNLANLVEESGSLAQVEGGPAKRGL